MARLSAGLVLDLVSITSEGLGVLDALLMAAIVQANLAEIGRRADLQALYAEASRVAPDALRRPITVNALANSLGLPFETVRRRLRRLEAKALCGRVASGVIVPASVLASTAYVARGSQAYARVRAFYEQMRDLGLLPELPAATVALGPGGLPLRAVARLASDYMLRVIEILQSVLPDLVDGLLVLAAVRANLEHLPWDTGGDEAPGGAQDTEPRPVPVTELARRLGLPAETARRHALQLAEQGVLRRVPGGMIAPAEALGGARLREAMVRNSADVDRLLTGLARLGVIDHWDPLARRRSAAGA